MRRRARSAVPAGRASNASAIGSHSAALIRGAEASRRQQSSQPFRQGQSRCVDLISSARARTLFWISYSTGVAIVPEGESELGFRQEVRQQLVELLRFLHHHEVAGARNFHCGPVRKYFFEVGGIIRRGVVRIDPQDRKSTRLN